MAFPMVQQIVDEALFSPDGMWLAMRGRQQPVRIFRVSDGEFLREWKVFGQFLDFTKDSKKLLMTMHSRKLGVWDIHSGQDLMELSAFDSPLTGAWLQENANRILTMTQKGVIQYWDLDDGESLSKLELRTSESQGDPDYRVVALSPDKRLLATIPHDNPQFIELWDLHTRERLAGVRAHQLSISALAFSPDSRWLATASNDATIKAWPVGLFVQPLDTSR